MAEETKHQFVDDYPYLVYAADDKAVYTADGNTPYVPSGGGSSDFTIAKLTFINNASASASFVLAVPVLLTDEETLMFSYLGAAEGAGGGDTYDVVLYKGQVFAELLALEQNTAAEIIMTVSGDIELDGSTTAIITGDGTITISD